MGTWEAMRRYALPLIVNVHTQMIAREWNLTEERFRDVLQMIGPLYGYRLPETFKTKNTISIGLLRKT